MRSPFFILLIPMWWKNARSVWNSIIWHSKIIKNPPQFLSKVQLCPDRIPSLKILPNSWKNSVQIRNCAAISEKNWILKSRKRFFYFNCKFIQVRHLCCSSNAEQFGVRDRVQIAFVHFWNVVGTNLERVRNHSSSKLRLIFQSFSSLLSSKLAKVR